MTKNEIVQHMIRGIDSKGDMTFKQVIDKISELWEPKSESKSVCRCEETHCDNSYSKESKRTYEISELLKTKFGFNSVNVGYPDESNSRMVEVSYDGKVWYVLKLYSESPNHEILMFMREALSNNKWDDKYTLNSHSIVLKSIIEEYGLCDLDCVQIRNTICRLNHDTDSVFMDKITDTAKLKNISLNFDDENSLTSFILTTDDDEYIFSDEAFEDLR